MTPILTKIGNRQASNSKVEPFFTEQGWMTPTSDGGTKQDYGTTTTTGETARMPSIDYMGGGQLQTRTYI